VEVCERDAEVYGVVLGGGLKAVGFEDGLLLLINPTASRLPASARGLGRITMEMTLMDGQSGSREKKVVDARPYL